MRQPIPRYCRRTAWVAALLKLCVGPALAASLSAQHTQIQQGNPFRGEAKAIESGHLAYNAHCARCHGNDANQPTAEAPDLRRLNGFCNRLKDPALKSHCLLDVDTYFLESVQEGKVRAGVQYMPPWKEVLTADTLWEIRSFIEVQPPDPPRVRTSVDRAAGH